MRHLFEDWDRIKQNLNNKFIALFLDYDGTISPIADNPETAFIPKETRQLLYKLLKSPVFRLAIISGRALKDIKEKIGIEGIIYAGNHGLEIEGPKIKFESSSSVRYKETLQRIKDGLNTKLSTIKGAFIEDKGLSLSIHYRLADRSQTAKLKALLRESTILYTAKDKIRIEEGKKVFEIRPAVEWDKGKVVLWLLARWKFSLHDKDIMPVYLGDDISDEDAFGILRNKGLTVFIGRPRPSYANYYLKDTREVYEFLNKLLFLTAK